MGCQWVSIVIYWNILGILIVIKGKYYWGYNLNYPPINEQFTAKPWPIEFDDVLS